MTWSWSHTAEAYANAEANLRALPIATLGAIWAEWRASKRDSERPWSEPELDSKRYRRELQRFHSRLRREANLAPDARRSFGPETGSDFLDSACDEIWTRASEQASCTNGGWKAYLCPFECGCHTVPFDRADPDQNPIET